MKRLPDFAVEAGYPFVPPVSIETYPAEKRIGEIMHINDGLIHMNKEAMEKKLGLEPNAGDTAFERAFSIGMVNHLLEAEHALAEAENQIVDMMKDLPFVPEDFGFEKVASPAELSDDPIKIYKSKFTGGILISNIAGENNEWTVMKDGIKMSFVIPCARVALYLFAALSISVREKSIAI